MLIFQKNNIIYVFIHIPKNCGKYIRDNIHSRYKIIKNFWDIDNEIDLAHIPYLLVSNYINFSRTQNISFFTFVRNPYSRLISIFFYKNPQKTINDFINFIKNELTYFIFDEKFDSNIVHYYPQYLFLVDQNKNVNKDIRVFKLEEYDYYDNNFIKLQNFNLKKYNLCDYYSNDTLEIVNAIYFNDFKIFNYPIKSSVSVY